MKLAFKLWGWLCLCWAALYLILSLWAAGGPGRHFNPGPTGLGEWIGMGLISLGLARVIELLEKK